jgi:hypothetical protein
MFEKNFYGIFAYVVISLINSIFFLLIEDFFDNILELYKVNSGLNKFLIYMLSNFLTNFWFQDLFKERIREACLINFLTYKLNFEISRFK